MSGVASILQACRLSHGDEAATHVLRCLVLNVFCFARVGDGVALLHLEEVSVDRYAVVWIRFSDRFFGGPVVPVINAEDDAETLVIFDDRFEDFL